MISCEEGFAGSSARVATLRDDERELFLLEPESPIDRATWRVFTVRQDQGEAGVIEADLLRPQDWFGVEVRVEDCWELDLGELGLAGDVEIVAVSPCPSIEQGPGRVVLSAFRHSRGVVGTIRLIGSDEPFRLTAGHPVWSSTRANWVSASELQPGEELRTWQGAAVVESPWEPDGYEPPVYNIEVDADHVLRVGSGGLLVHNASPDQSSNPGTPGMQPDHVFATGFRAALPDMASDLSCAWPELDAALRNAGTMLQTPPFSLTVTRTIPRPDRHSEAFGQALDSMRRAIENFLDSATAPGGDFERARQAHSARLRTAWTALVNAVEDTEVSLLVTRPQQSLVTQGRQTLTRLKMTVESVIANP